MRCFRVVFFAAILSACQSRSGLAPAPSKDLVFTNVFVIGMESEKVLPGQTVLIRNGVIAGIGSNLDIPTHALVIDASGKYLMPALADMHVHLQNEQDLTVLAALGIALVRNMHADSPEILRWKTEVSKGARFAPEIVAAGPLFDGPYQSHPGAVTEKPGVDLRRSVAQQKDDGFDFIKIYDALSPEAFQQIVGAASEIGIPVVGHVPYRVGLEQVLNARIRSLEHLSGFAEASEKTGSPYHTDYSIPWKDTKAYWNDAWLGGTGVRFAYADEKAFPKLAKKTRDSGVWVCPTLIQRDTFVKSSQGTIFSDRSHWEYFPPAMTEGWQKMTKESPFKLPPRKDLEKSWKVRRSLVRELHKEGVPLLLGTDLGNLGILAGYSVYEELENLTQAGLTPFEALKTATRNPSEFLGRNGGTIAVGKKADLILLSDNPLKNLDALKKREGIVLRGNWYNKAALQEKLDALANAYRAGSLHPKTYYGQ